MKKILIICGTGVATSTVVTNRVKEWLNENELGKNTQIYQGKVSDQLNRLDEYDVVISTTMVSEEYKDQVINAVPLLTKIGEESVFEQIREALNK